VRYSLTRRTNSCLVFWVLDLLKGFEMHWFRPESKDRLILTFCYVRFSLEIQDLVL